MTEAEIDAELEQQVRLELNQARARNPLIKEWAQDEIAKLVNGRKLRQRALAELRRGIAGDQAGLDSLFESKQLPNLR
jgi:hypothetical protein